MKKIEKLTIQEILDNFKFDPLVPGNIVKTSIDEKEHLLIYYKGGNYRISHIAYVLHNKKVPAKAIMHINGNKLDNSKENLKEASHAEYMKRRSKKPSNKSGTIGVSWDKLSKCWMAKGVLNGKTSLYQRYNNKKDAIAARKEWEKENGITSIE